MKNAIRDSNASALLTTDTSAFLRSIRSAMTTLLDNTDESLRQKLGDVYAAAKVLSLDKDQWQAFCEQEEWRSFRGKPKPIDADRAKALKYAVRYAVGFDGVPANQATYRYTKALEGCWTEKTPPGDVPKLIKAAGGLEKLKQKNAQKKNDLVITFESNSITERIDELDCAFNAIFLVHFEKKKSSKRTARIVLAVGSKTKPPSLSVFKKQYLEEIELKNGT